MKRTLILGLLAAALLPAGAARADLKIVTTTTDFADLARQIGGERVTVHSVMKGPENVHNVPYTSNHHIAEYDALREKCVGGFKAVAAQAMGDPDKAMNLLVDAVRGEGKAKGRELPLYLMLGNVTYDHVREHCARLLEDMDKWEDIAKDLDFDPEH